VAPKPTMGPDPGKLIGGVPGGWPQPSGEALAHSRKLAEHLAHGIAQGGNWISFQGWMETALYEPGLGYYSAGAARFGPAGDFITAPVISSLFGWTLARQCARALEDCGGDTILEFGPGKGDLAADVLLELDRLQALPERYLLLERGGALRQQQQERLSALPAHLSARVQWLDRPPQQPVRGVILANEVADALAVQRFRRTASGVDVVGVSMDGGRFVLAERPADAGLTAAVEALERELGRRFPAGYCSEISPQLPGWMGVLGDSLEAGLALIIDYGYARRDYYMDERRDGTLMCHYRHRAHGDPLLLPGLQDMTAFVDFTAAAEGAVAAGLDVIGFASQAHFLLGAGLPGVLEERAREQSEADYLRLAQQAKTLVMPGEMGERFQVLAVGRGLTREVSGFSLYNQLHRL